MNLKDELAKDLAFLRRESLDIYNRIHSIAEDVGFVNQVTAQYSDYPVIRELSKHCVESFDDELLLANLRCGAWYVHPELVSTLDTLARVPSFELEY